MEITAPVPDREVMTSITDSRQVSTSGKSADPPYGF
jgi:hypothetical protein